MYSVNGCRSVGAGWPRSAGGFAAIAVRVESDLASTVLAIAIANVIAQRKATR